jgi:predicted patatin/cPLA2 family phospholipase
VALAVEGGAMRGVISAGMVSALEALGLTNAFDAVFGSSAGSINAAYFLAGQARLGTSIYFEDINNRRFIDLGRAFRGRAIFDLQFLLEDVAVRRKPLDVEKVLGAFSPLTVLATDVDAETAVPLAGFEDAGQLFAALRAGATMPVVAGQPHPYEGRRYLDASITQPIPVPAAEMAGHANVLVLLTRDGTMRPRPSAFDRYFVGPRLRRLSPSLAAKYLGRATRYATLMQQIKLGIGPGGRARLVGLSVEGLRISKLERRADVLRAGARLGYEAVMRAFDAGADECPFT